MYRMSLNRVHDTVRVSEGTESLLLHVDADAGRMVAGIAEAAKALKNITDESTDTEKRNVAQYFATEIFGEDGAASLIRFYHNDPVCVINLCGQYLDRRLKKLIAKAQKKGARK